MEKKTKIGIAHSDADLGKPGEYSRAQLDLVKGMIRQVADPHDGRHEEHRQRAATRF